jgi:hypothetical protein
MEKIEELSESGTHNSPNNLSKLQSMPPVKLVEHNWSKNPLLDSVTSVDLAKIRSESLKTLADKYRSGDTRKVAFFALFQENHLSDPRNVLQRYF